MPTVMITVVYAPGCHFCADAQAALTELGRQFPIHIQLVEAGSDAGGALVAEYRPGMFPLVLVDGAFFSTGRLPRRKLHDLLAGRQAVAAR